MTNRYPRHKVLPLDEAVAAHVRTRDHLHFVTAGARPNAHIRAIVRRFWEEPQAADLVVSATSFGGTQLGLALLANGLVRRVIAGYVGHQYPTPGPAAVARDALASGTTFELWSLLTLIQRLRAGAMGLKWTTTASLADGSLASADVDVRHTSLDGHDVTLIPALRPDVALVHAVIADETGNAVLAAPYTEGLVGAFAAQRGALVTAEKIVSRVELRRHAHLQMIPSSLVLAVSEAPLGAHPSALFAEGIDPSLSYSDDYEFLVELRAALEGERPQREAWLATNLAHVAQPDDYVQHLGADRIHRLRSGWRSPSHGPTDEVAEGPTRAERMILAAAAFLYEHVGRERPSFLFAGIGVSSLAAWVAQARSESFPPLVSEMGFYDYVPLPGDPWLFATANMSTCSILSDTETVLGSLVQGHAESGLAVLATAQVDGTGRLNTTVAGDRFITGSGGANDVTSMIRDVVIVVPHDRTRLVESVDYVTSPGAHTVAIITDRAVFVRNGGDFILAAVVVSPSTSRDLEEATREILEATPWRVSVSTSIQFLDPVDAVSLRALRSFDPERYFLRDRTGAKPSSADDRGATEPTVGSVGMSPTLSARSADA